MNSNKWEFRTFTGTPKYLAPEVFKIKWGGSAYGYSVDVWSNGAIAYLMLTGKSLPVDYVMQCRYDEKQPDLKLPAGTIISESGMLFLEKMLMEDPSARPKVIETFEKEWFQDDSGGDFSTR